VLAVLPEGRVATVRLHPTVARSMAASELPAIVEVAGDPTMAPADALVELADHVLDLRVDRALARVREVLA
jgi:flagellar assembly protein FliH